MSDLFAALRSSGDALQAFERAVDVTQNNVTNANSPGYVKQVPIFESLPFQLGTGFGGGVVEHTEDTRSQFAEAAVQQQLSLQGQFQQLQTSLAPLETIFDVSANSAIPSALNQLFQSFSQWSTQPNDSATQQTVISSAQQVASAFQQVAAQLANARALTDRSLQSAVSQINADAQKIVQYNQQVATRTSRDAGLEAQLYSTLEDLSNVADIQVIPGNGNTVTVLLGGQVPLVIGEDLNALQVESDPSSGTVGTPNLKIVDSHANDVTPQITSGTLAGLLTVRNSVIPSLAGGGQQAGDINTLAKGLADAVNNLLLQGSTTPAPPYQLGTAIFTYNAASPSNTAASLKIDPTFTTSQLAATDPGPPPVSNGIALKLAALDNPGNGQVNGLTFTQYFSSLATRVGNAVSNASTAAASQAQLVNQAKALRQQLSGVSVDEEAIRLIQLQRSFQAVGKIVTVIDELTQTLMNMV